MRRFMIALLGGAGVLHFLKPEPFDSIVPAGLPGSARAYTYASGVAELGCAAAMACPDEKVRRYGGLATATLMTAVFPANVEMARQWTRAGKGPAWLAVAYGRLPLQLPLIWSGWSVWRSPRR